MSDYNEKLKTLKNGALKNIEKKFGENSYFLGEKKIPSVPLICSSGSLSLDNALCIGGFPEGRIIEIGGQESSGKSTLTLLNIAEVQRNGKLCAYLDVEQSFDPVYSSRLGVDVDSLTVLQPETMEETFEMLFDLIGSGVISYIVVDSENAMIPKKMLEGDTDTSMMGKSALLMSQQLPKVVSLAATNKCTVVFLAQERSKIGVVYGNPMKMGVGEAMKFYASIRIRTSKSEVQKDDEEGQSAVDINMSIIKNKVGAPFKKASFTLLTGADGKYGIDTIKEVLDFAVKFDFIKKTGAWFTYGNERFQGIANVRKYMEENIEAFNSLKSSIVSKLAEEREKAQTISSNSNTFNSAITEAVLENEKPARKRKVKIEEDTTVEEQNVSDAEVIEEAKTE